MAARTLEQLAQALEDNLGQQAAAIQEISTAAKALAPHQATLERLKIGDTLNLSSRAKPPSARDLEKVFVMKGFPEAAKQPLRDFVAIAKKGNAINRAERQLQQAIEAKLPERTQEAVEAFNRTFLERPGVKTHLQNIEQMGTEIEAVMSGKVAKSAVAAVGKVAGKAKVATDAAKVTAKAEPLAKVLEVGMDEHAASKIAMGENLAEHLQTLQPYRKQVQAIMQSVHAAGDNPELIVKNLEAALATHKLPPKAQKAFIGVLHSVDGMHTLKGIDAVLDSKLKAILPGQKQRQTFVEAYEARPETKAYDEQAATVEKKLKQILPDKSSKGGRGGRAAKAAEGLLEKHGGKMAVGAAIVAALGAALVWNSGDRQAQRSASRDKANSVA